MNFDHDSIYNVCHGRRKPRPVKILLVINEGLVLLKLADTVLILTSNVKTEILRAHQIASSTHH